ncbi:M48 family metalloprotease [Halomonas daqiaonensis]|uniref:Putative metalloprotease n=1 Tax=Halomonas daqiaonensis TaxID=650850 RepID=A0A1H7RZ56_9GAMM|nr:M48 family metalloprotease [Halomonas daqiaonensis]SEL65505.1 putative metalloprotease [Halomonas daqiaonensis]
MRLTQRLAAMLVIATTLSGCAAIQQPERQFKTVNLTLPTGDSQTILQLERTLVLDQEVLNYVNGIRERLELAHGSPCDCQVVVDASGGYEGYIVSPKTIVISAGLLAQADSEDEVAAMIAHEMSHALEGDSTKTWLQETVSSTLRLGAIVASDSSEKIGYSALIGESAHEAAKGVIYRHWNAEDEIKADAFAVDLLAKAGYSQDGLKMMIRRLGEYSEQVIANRSQGEAHCLTGKQGTSELNIDLKACTAQLTGSRESIYLSPEMRLEAALEKAWEQPPQKRRQRASPPPPFFDSVDYLFAMNTLVFNESADLRAAVEAIKERPLPTSLEGNVTVSNRMVQAYGLLDEPEQALHYWEQSANSENRTPWTFSQLLKVADMQRNKPMVQRVLGEMGQELGMVPAMLPAEYYLARRYDLFIHEGITLARCALNLAGDIEISELCSEYGKLAKQSKPLNW